MVTVSVRVGVRSNQQSPSNMTFLFVTASIHSNKNTHGNIDKQLESNQIIQKSQNL